MRTNIVLDDKLVRQAMKLSKANSKREVVDLALREFVESKARITAMKEMFGSDGIDPTYDYKVARIGSAR